MIQKKVEPFLHMAGSNWLSTGGLSALFIPGKNSINHFVTNVCQIFYLAIEGFAMVHMHFEWESFGQIFTWRSALLGYPQILDRDCCVHFLNGAYDND